MRRFQFNTIQLFISFGKRQTNEVMAKGIKIFHRAIHIVRYTDGPIFIVRNLCIFKLILKFSKERFRHLSKYLVFYDGHRHIFLSRISSVAFMEQHMPANIQIALMTNIHDNLAIRFFNNGAIHADFFDATLLSCRSVHMQNISKNMQYISKEDRKITLDPYTMKTNNPIQRPLCVMMNWMLAKPKHVLKYANVYLEQDFDVVAVSCSPMQLMWPVKGSKIIAADLMKFLENNPSYGPLVVHGFSVGAYVWAELLVHSLENKERYQPVLDRVNAQIWDSPADVYEIPIGLPNAVFPKNKILQKALRAYTIFHMKLLNNVATKHYMRATQVYHNTPCRAPGLFLCSLTDPIGAAKRSRHAHDTWKSLGVKVNWKCWDKSPHIQHFIYHTEEYLAALYSHLGQSGVIKPIAQR